MTESIPVSYPYKATNEILKKKHKEKLLKDRPETLYSDLYKNREVSNIIFYTEDPEAWHSAIRQHYPTVIRKGISNGWKLQVKEEDDSESDVMITANLYKNGTVMIQGNLKKFEKDFLQIKGKAQLNKTSPNTLKRAEDTSISTHQATTEQSRDESEEISLLHSIISDMKEKFREMELELVQLREEVHGAVQQTDPTEKDELYRKEIAMLKKEIHELKNQKEEYNKQLSVMREEMRELREDRRKTSENGKQLSALKEQLTPTEEERQRLEQTPPPTTTSINPPPPDSYSPTQPQIILLMDSNGKFVDEKKLFPRRNIKKIWCPNTQKALELLCEEQLGSPSHIIIHTGTNELRAQQERVATALVNVAEKASSNFPNSRIILSTLLLRSDFHPDTIRHINARVSRDCALKPNVYLAQHPTLNLNSLYDHVHLHRRAVPIFAKTLKDMALSRSSSALQRPHGHPIEPLQRHPSDQRPLHRRTPTAGSRRITRPAAPSHQQQHPDSQSYAEAASRSLINPSTNTDHSQPTASQSRDLRNIQHMLTLLCSHLMEKYERLEADKKKQVHKKRRFEGPSVRYHSVLMLLVPDAHMEENVDVEGLDQDTPQATPTSSSSAQGAGSLCSRTYITFSDDETFSSAFPASARSSPAQPVQEVCPVTHKPALYRDPVTDIPYANARAFRIIREAYQKYIAAHGFPNASGNFSGNSDFNVSPAAAAKSTRPKAVVKHTVVAT